MSEKKVSIYTLGCRLNFAESGTLAEQFSERGYSVVPFEEPADVVLINTCTVTDGADSNCRNIIRKAQKISPTAKVVVVGCYAQMESDKISKMEGVDLVLGTSEKYRVFDYLDELNETVHIDKCNDFFAAATTKADSHTRAFLKIQDGCNYVCAYCIIPFARGRSRATSISSIITSAEKLVAEGFKEIVLTGVNIGEYQSSSGERLEDLIAQILKVDGLERLRISSIEPNTVTDELLAILKSSDKFMQHFHIPLQSGDDDILSAMRRKYTTSDYRNIINKIHTVFPQAAIGADIIVGLPGESEQQFQNSYDLMSELPLTHFHVFPYSKRKNTTAASMEDQIPKSVKKERAAKLSSLGDEKLLKFSESLLGSKTNVLFELEKDGYWEGYTPTFLRVKCVSKENLENKIRQVKLINVVGEILSAEIQ